jgi:aspartyl-tRNA(Asn)/glutamyl-tRNA(Gln) amidotransferase subunit A
MSELAYLSFVEAARRIRAKDLSPVEYTEALLARIDTHNPSLDAFLHLTAEQALHGAQTAADAIAAGQALGPMHGVPFALKDIIDVEGLPTTAHSQILADNVARQDAHVTERFRAAGAILLGKLSTHEFAFGGPCFDLPWPPARNPWDRRMFPGGSSSGSGAAVAAGLVPAALGTDTGGSVRNPASMCGIVGMKATYGRVSRRGVIPLSYSLDHIGPMTRTVEENAALLNVIAGFDAHDPGSANEPVPNYLDAVHLGQGESLKGLRVGVIRHFYREDMIAHPAVDAGIEAALGVLAGLGAEIEEVTTRPLGEFSDGNRVILLSEGYAVHERWMQTRPQDYAEMTRQKLLPGAFLRAADYVQGLRNRTGFSTAVDQLLEHSDVLVTASSMDPPFLIDDAEAVARCYPRQARAPFNLTGHPAVAVPGGYYEADGEPALPLSFQLIGRHFDEATLYRVAAAYEQATGWIERHPPLDD